MSAILDSPPDFVLSGINKGPYWVPMYFILVQSQQQWKRRLMVITSIALSLASFTSEDFEPSANYAVKLIKELIDNPLPEATLLSVNIPAVAESEIKGVKVTRQGIRRYQENFQKRHDLSWS